MDRFRVRQFSIERLVIALLMSLLAIPFSCPANGQTAVGVQQFGAYDGSPDIVDLGTLNIHLEIPLYHKAGRGSGTGIGINLYDSASFPAATVVSPSGMTYWLNTGPGVSFGSNAGNLSSVSPAAHDCVTNTAFS